MNASLSVLVCVKFSSTSSSNSISCTPSVASTSTLNVTGPPSPEGATGSTMLTRCRFTSTPSIIKTAVTGSSVSSIPMLEYCPEIVTISPGSGSVGVNPIPLPSARGAKSGFPSLTSISPIRMSRYPSPSISAIAGEAQVRCGKSIAEDHPIPISAERPVVPSNAKRRSPYATNNSGSSSPSRSITNGAEIATSPSLSFPLPLCRTLDHSR